MIAVWMLYCLGIGLAFVVVGHALERGLHLAGRPTRWAWVVALVGSYLVPVAAWVRPDAFATFPLPISSAIASAPNVSTAASSTTSTILDQPPARSFSLTDLDAPLRWGWGAGSVLMLGALVIAAARLVSARRRWRREAVDGRVVLVSRNVGPAVVGVWSPRVVLPEWALSLPASDRELMLAHEEQHVRGADPALLACGFVLVLLAPWNLALWWQWRRLRLAVEMDCDARVLAEGRSAPAYGELLLHVGRRRSTQLVGAAAFGEPASFLESRIRRMLSGMPRWRWVGALAALVVAVGALVGACETPRPVGPARHLVEAPATPSVGITGVVSAVIEPADVDQPPAVLSGATTSFPDLLRLAGIEGRVVVQARIEANGRADSGSIAVVQSPHPALAQSAKSAVLRSRFRPAQARGQPVAAVVHVVYDFTTTRSVIQQRARDMTDRISITEAERLRPWVRENVQRLFPLLLEQRSGPPMDVFLVHDSHLQVHQGKLTDRTKDEIGIAELRAAFRDFNAGHDGWGVIDPRGLRGLLRDNVRVIRINHEPQAGIEQSQSALQARLAQTQKTIDDRMQELSAQSEQVRQSQSALQGRLAQSQRALDDRMQELNEKAEQARRLARRYHPEVYGRSGSQTAVALVMDSNGGVLAHAARDGEARGADGLYHSGEDCQTVLERLVPQYKNTKWSVSGCAGDAQQSNVIVYWGIPLIPLTR